MRTSFNALGLVCAVGLAAISAPPLGAQESEHPLTEAAYAAGYKAAFTCSATFNAGKSSADIAAGELTGIYPGYRRLMRALPDADVDQNAFMVSVSYRDDLPPRLAVWRPFLGCSLLPPLSSIEAKVTLPSLADEPTYADPDYPENAGRNDRLETVLDKAFAAPGLGYGTGARTSAVLIATPDAILAERYGMGHTARTSQRTWSVAKSLAVTVIGAAVQDGLLDIEAPTGLAEWQGTYDPRRAISIENLLHMASGLDSNRTGSRTDRLYVGGGSVDQTSVQNVLEARPGTRWKYANNDTLLAVRALREAIADDQAYHAYPFTSLLGPLGMRYTVPETDSRGNFILSSQVWTTARDLMQVGRLYLADGVFGGKRILPEGWAAYVGTANGPQPSSGTPGYGAQWWLYGNPDQYADDLPAGTYAARGNRGQFLMILPSQNLIIIRRGYDIAGMEGFQLDRFAEDILRALDP